MLHIKCQKKGARTRKYKKRSSAERNLYLSIYLQSFIGTFLPIIPAPVFFLSLKLSPFMNFYVSISGRSSRCRHFFPVSLVITQQAAAATTCNHHHGWDVPFSSNATKNIEIREAFLSSSCPTQPARINVGNVLFCKMICCNFTFL